MPPTSPESAPSSSMFSFTRFKELYIWGTVDAGGVRTEALLDQMRKSTVFKDCDEVERRDICEIMEPFEFKKGDVMFIQGEPVDKAIFIIKGRSKAAAPRGRPAPQHASGWQPGICGHCGHAAYDSWR